MNPLDTFTSPAPPNGLDARPAALPLPRTPGGSQKIHARHRERLAVVYLRQSSPHQVLVHRESRELQYALVDTAVALGWPRDRVLLIDEDLGCSASTPQQRSGFARVIAEVGMQHAGIVFGREMSRLSRSGKDSFQLLEACGLFDTLLADEDGVYDLADFNDRLLLGLKGTMSEAELHLMRQRLHHGRLNKARRGELFHHAPSGYVRDPCAGLVRDPDEQVQAVVQLLFDQFDRLGSAGALLRFLVEHDIRLPVRPHGGPRRGELEWRRPSRSALLRMLRHPVYAGIYTWGRRRTQTRGGRAGVVCTLPPEEWLVRLPDRCPAYIEIARFQANLQRLAANRSRAAALGVPRQGPALLRGLVHCGQCGCRMLVSYSGRTNQPRYTCQRRHIEYGAALCQSIASAALDRPLAEQVLAVLEPAALELSLAAADDLERQRAQLTQHARQGIERARWESDRAARQYHAVEPENRLVARELERHWEQSLRTQRELEENYERARREQPTPLEPEERAAIGELARDIPALWHAADTPNVERQAMVRHLIERVVVCTQGHSERVDVTVHWVGGCTSQLELIRPVARWKQLRDYEALQARVRELRDAGRSSFEVAEQLNREGWCSPRGCARFSAVSVRQLLSGMRQASAGAPGSDANCAGSPALTVGCDEWWLSDLAARLEIPAARLYSWIRRGRVQGRQLSGVQGRWLVHADPTEVDRLRQGCSGTSSHRPAPCTTDQAVK